MASCLWLVSFDTSTSFRSLSFYLSVCVSLSVYIFVLSLQVSLFASLSMELFSFKEMKACTFPIVIQIVYILWHLINTTVNPLARFKSSYRPTTSCSVLCTTYFESACYLYFLSVCFYFHLFMSLYLPDIAVTVNTENGPYSAPFRVFWSFLNKQYVNNIFKKYPSSTRCRDSNSNLVITVCFYNR